jgi:hypothetical protein
MAANGSGALAINFCVPSMLDHDDCVCRFSEIGIFERDPKQRAKELRSVSSIIAVRVVLIPRA